MSTSNLSPYKILGVEEGASLSDCEAARRKLAKKYHPDLNPNDYLAEEAMKKINAAYDAIKSGKAYGFAVNASQYRDGYTQNSAKYKGDVTNKTNETRNANTEPRQPKNKQEFASKTNQPKTKTDVKMINTYELKQLILKTVISVVITTGLVILLLKYSDVYFENFTKLIEDFFELYNAKAKWWYLFDVQESVFNLILPYTEYQKYIEFLIKFCYCSVVSVASVYALTFLNNMLHLVFIVVSNQLKESKLDMRKTIKCVGAFDILHQIITYISLLMCWMSVSLVTILMVLKCLDFVTKDEPHLTFYYIALFYYFIVSIAILIVGIRHKYNRKRPKLKNFENVGTYTLGLLFTMIPFLIELITAFALPIVTIIILLVIIGFIANALTGGDYVIIMKKRW